jgi:membrane-bound metal-dependent hydrolase YbcI (DUF457 family)
MFIGHFAVGFGSKKFAPRASLAVLIGAAIFSDILWPIFLLLGWEHMRVLRSATRFTSFDLYDFPWSHSLVMTAVWATLFALVYRLWKRDRRGAIVIWFVVLSHWVLDWVTHRPDMPLFPGSARYGLGLWNSVAGTLVVELLLFVVGLGMYAQSTKPLDRIGEYAYWAYAALLLMIYAGGRFSELPKTTAQVAWPGVAAIAVLLPWAWWFDHHRVALELQRMR